MSVVETVYNQIRDAIETAGFVVVDDLSEEILSRIPVSKPPVVIELDSISSNENLTDTFNSIIGVDLNFSITILHRRNEPDRLKNIETLITAIMRVETNTSYRISLEASFTRGETDMEVTEITVTVPTFLV